MEKLFNEWVIEHFGLSFVIVCAIVVGIIVLTVWCCKVWYKIRKIDELPCNEHKDDITSIKGKVFPKDELPCATHQQKLSEHGETLARLETSVEFLSRSVDAFAQEAQKSMRTSGLTQTRSPLNITEKGWEKVRSLGMEGMLDNNWDRIKGLIDDGVKDKNAYDIDRYCIEQSVVYPEKFLAPKEILALKNDAFREGLTLTSYMKIIAVLSRDRYFETIGLNKEVLEEK